MWLWASVWVLLACGCAGSQHLRDAKGTDTYAEELSITRLPTGHVLSQFRFVVTSAQLGSDYKTYPRIIAEVLRKYAIREFHLSLVQGFWRTADWGIAPQPSAPSGAELYAWMDQNEQSVDDRWDQFVNSLNGIFCTSLLELVPELTTTFQDSFLPRGLTSSNSSLRYGALSGETVCTENLTPWKKLLPCKQTGLSTLLNPTKLYEAVFHSMSVHALQVCAGDSEPCEVRQRLELDLNLVSEIDLFTHSLDWSLMSLFGRKVDEQCVIADSSNIIVEKDRATLSLSANSAAHPTEMKYFAGPKFYVYNLHFLSADSFPLNIMARYSTKLTLPTPASEALVSVHTILAGVGQQSGRLVSTITNRQVVAQTVLYTHVIPWFMRIYYHTIQVQCRDSKTGAMLNSTVNGRKFVLAKDRKRPFTLEWNVTLPRRSLCDLSFNFDKAFLRVTEFPPDANHGKYVPAAVLTLVASKQFWRDNRTALGGYRATALEQLAGRDVSHTVTIYGEALLVLLPVPDFSMPFNVICLVCTAIALLFGPVHSLTTKTMIPISEKDKDVAPKAPLAALIVVIRSVLVRILAKLKGILKKQGESEATREENVANESQSQPGDVDEEETAKLPVGEEQETGEEENKGTTRRHIYLPRRESF